MLKIKNKVKTNWSSLAKQQRPGDNWVTLSFEVLLV